MGRNIVHTQFYSRRIRTYTVGELVLVSTLTNSLAAAVAALAVVVVVFVGAVVFDIPFCRRSSLTIAGTFIVFYIYIVEV